MFDGLDQWDRGQAVYLIALLLFILLSSAVVRRNGVGKTLSMLLVWLVVIGVVAFAANRRDQLLSLLGEQEPVIMADGEGVRLTARDDGHFWVRAKVNGETVLFLIDTGASDIVLSQAAAKRVGIETGDLSFDRPAMTANGMVRGAAVKLRTIEIGGILRSDMSATVTEGPLATNLLGMRYMRTLKGWRVDGPVLTLYP